ncbi:hypothetical protein [Pseudomonas sp. MYb185]|uniref:hypothetical protein n=1 Tax=Pseudomonas sp. MYb185 TaxID=1848729 RepID=UPI000CFAF907|nr:hypothetical protein [Pseudomonas sp. MYb185]PRB80526.1 hypothetical protein CQ007_12455 [Pseudomonas sp. MYb185]
MIHAPDRSFIGVGVLSSKRYQAPTGLLEVGNCNTLAIQHATEDRALPNYRTGIGNNNSQTRVTAVTGSFNLHDVTPANLAFLLNATINSVAAGTVPDEVHGCGGQPRELIVFKYLPDPTQPITLTAMAKSATASAASGNAGDGAITGLSGVAAAVGVYTVTLTSPTAFSVTDAADALVGTGTVGTAFSQAGLEFTLVEGDTDFVADDSFTITVTEASTPVGEQGTDWVATPYGIQLTEATGLPAGSITVNYTRLAADVTEVLAQAGAGEKTLHFAGLNDAQNSEPFDIMLYRVKFRLIQELPVSTTEYAALAVTFEALQDVTRVGNGLSQFYTIRQLARSA